MAVQGLQKEPAHPAAAASLCAPPQTHVSPVPPRRTEPSERACESAITLRFRGLIFRRVHSFAGKGSERGWKSRAWKGALRYLENGDAGDDNSRLRARDFPVRSLLFTRSLCLT